MDVMPGIGGLEATRRCLRVDPDLKVIILTMHEREPFPSQFMNIGAHGYLTKGADVNEMVRAIARYDRQRYSTDEVAQQLALQPFDDNQECPFTKLSGREMQIALMVTKGVPVPEISVALSLSPKTSIATGIEFREAISAQRRILNKTCDQTSHHRFRGGRLNLNALSERVTR